MGQDLGAKPDSVSPDDSRGSTPNESSVLCFDYTTILDGTALSRPIKTGLTESGLLIPHPSSLMASSP